MKVGRPITEGWKSINSDILFHGCFLGWPQTRGCGAESRRGSNFPCSERRAQNLLTRTSSRVSSHQQKCQFALCTLAWLHLRTRSFVLLWILPSTYTDSVISCLFTFRDNAETSIFIPSFFLLLNIFPQESNSQIILHLIDLIICILPHCFPKS